MPKIEIPQLTGLRFMAAFSILFLHAVVWCTPFNDTPVALAIANVVGVFGMPLFFVLSGFVIHYNYAILFRERSLGGASRSFFWARFARIYPLYLFFMLFGSLSDFTSNWISWAPREFGEYVFHHLTLTQSWVYRISIHDRLVLGHGFGLAWSLSTEFFFYLLYPLFVFAILRIRKASAGVIAASAFAVFAIVLLYVLFTNFAALEAFAKTVLRDAPRPGNHTTDASFYRWFFYYSPYIRILEFVLGCLTAQLFLIVRDRPVTATERGWAGVVFAFALAWLIGFCAIFGISIALPGSLGPAGSFGNALVTLTHVSSLNFGIAVPLAIIIFYAGRYDTSVTARFLALPVIVWLGDISYSIYVVHTWTLRPLIRPAVAFSDLYLADAVLRVSFGIAFTFIVAAGTYRLIEQPSRRYLRGLMKGGTTATQPASPFPNERPSLR